MKKNGFTLIDIVISIGILALLFGGVYLVYFSILDVVNSTELRTAATSVLARHLEIIRNLPYEQVGTVGGVPGGIISSNQTSTFDTVTFEIKTTVRNIDDPFDGTLGGVPNDTAPADYKVVELEASCPSCARFIPMRITTTVAPKNLETSSNRGSLFINVFDASALPILAAEVRVRNASITPPIDVTDTTNVNGVLQLVDIATSSLGYRIDISLPGYTSERTYTSGDPANPNPLPQYTHATVLQGTLTTISFAIDRVSTLVVRTHDTVCAPYANKSFSASGTKLIGTNPDVYKFSTSSITNASGVKTFSNLEWDTYAIALNAPEDVVGTIPFSPVLINPNEIVNFSFVLQSANPNSLLVTVKDAATMAAIPGAMVTLSRPGFSAARITGQSTFTHTTWQGGAYTSQDGGVETELFPGSLRLTLNASSSYTTSTTSWLISNTFDTGGTTSTFYSLHWNPTSQMPSVGTSSVRFQLASNNDTITWDFIGPDGTGNTYYASSGLAVAPLHLSRRYLRYKIYLRTDDETVTPEISDVQVHFNGVCVPLAHALFTGLANDSYTLTAVAPLYQLASSSITISGAWQQAELLLSP